MSKIKTAVFWVITVVLVPALFLFLLEGGLRIAGYGKSYDYFRQVEINGKTYFQDNPDFGLQFFPAALNRTPLENTFADENPDNLVRVFVLGGSAARGFPDPEFGFARLLELMLAEALPGHRVEVINTAMTAINSHVVYEIAKAIPAGSADYSILLVGNNEVVGPFGPGTVFQGFSSSLAMIRLGQWVRRLRMGQLIGGALSGISSGEAEDDQVWKGMQMFAENKVARDDPRLEDVYAHYRSNLDDTIGLLRDAGSTVFLATVPVNLRDSAPFASLLDPALSAADRRTWERRYRRGMSLFENRDWEGAIRALHRAEEVFPGYADLQYQLGVAYVESGDFAAGNRRLETALDLDALRFRADPAINAVARSVARDHAGAGVMLVDMDEVFRAASAPQLPGKELFYEHVHFSFAGNYLLARSFAERIVKQVDAEGAWVPPSAAEVARRAGFPSQTTVRVMERLVNMVGLPPFAGQVNRTEQEDYLRQAFNDVKRRVGDAEFRIQRYRDLLREGHGDWRVRLELAKLLAGTGATQEATEQLRHVLKDYPHHFQGHVMLAALLQRTGKADAAMRYVEAARAYTRGDPRREANLDFRTAEILLAQGRQADAIARYATIVASYPDVTRIAAAAYRQMARLYGLSGRDSDRQRTLSEFEAYVEGLGAQGRADTRVRQQLAEALSEAGNDAAAPAGGARPAPDTH